MCKDGFTRNAADDGIHETVNEYRSAKWWSGQRNREALMERLMPFAIVAGALIGFCVVGIVELTR
jgi:hypothetical protein